ncbi:MAG: TonB-dependent receptor domain-containing protein [Gemmatimonadales bacterium]
MTNAAGRFQLDSIADGVYHLMIRQVGFAPAMTPDFTVAAGQLRDLGRIRIEAVAVRLAPLEVTVERPDVVFGADRTGYLVEALTAAAGRVITDALREIPDVIVDLDGTVRLRGATPTIFINGRPAPMQGDQVLVFLQNFPADRIERIEVLDAPPARFSAEGASGVINIVLREGVELGLTGSVAVSAGTRDQYSLTSQATLHRGKLMANGGLTARWSDMENADFTLRQNLLTSPITYLQQDARSSRSSGNGGTFVDLRYEVSPKSRFFGRFFGNLNGDDRNGRTETAHLDELRDATLQYDRLSRQDGHGRSADLRVGYQRTWIPERHTFEIETGASYNTNRNTTREEIAADSTSLGDELLPPWRTDRESGSRNRGLGFEIDYVRPFGKQGTIQVGTTLRRTSSREDQATSLIETPNPESPRQLDLRETERVQRTGSAYLTLQRRVGKVGVVAGLRGEWVVDRIELPRGERIDRDETNLFPSLSLNWTPRQRLSFRVSFSQRVGRPGLSVLDPTDRSTDPLNRLVGNPDIKSSLTRNISLGFNSAGRLGQVSLGPYWNRTTDGWERVTTVDSTGVSTSRYENLTSRTNLGASLNLSPPRVWGWTVRVNFSAARSTLEGSLRPEGLADGQVRWSVGGNLSGPVIRGIMAQGTFGYEPGRDLVQGRTSGQWRADFNFRYRLMNNRTTLNLRVQDPFALRRTTQEIRDPSVIQSSRSRVTTRSLRVNVSYSFGARGRGPDGAPRAMDH